MVNKSLEINTQQVSQNNFSNVNTQKNTMYNMKIR